MRNVGLRKFPSGPLRTAPGKKRSFTNIARRRKSAESDAENHSSRNARRTVWKLDARQHAFTDGRAAGTGGGTCRAVFRRVPLECSGCVVHAGRPGAGCGALLVCMDAAAILPLGAAASWNKSIRRFSPIWISTAKDKFWMWAAALARCPSAPPLSGHRRGCWALTPGRQPTITASACVRKTRKRRRGRPLPFPARRCQ